MNEFAKFLTALVATTVGLFLIILPGLLFVLAWQALGALGVGVGWRILIVILIILFLAWLGFSNFKEIEKAWVYNTNM